MSVYIHSLMATRLYPQSAHSHVSASITAAVSRGCTQWRWCHVQHVSHATAAAACPTWPRHTPHATNLNIRYIYLSVYLISNISNI